MRIVVIIFAVLSLLGAAGLGSITLVRANKEVASAKESFDELEKLKADAEKDEYAKMKYEMTQKVLAESGMDQVTPGRLSAWGYTGLLTGIVAFITLILVFTKKDSLTMYAGIGVIVLGVATYLVAPTIPEPTGIFAAATFKQVSMSLLVPSVIGGGLAILATKLRKPATV